MPIRNEAAYIDVCLESLVAQTYAHARLSVIVTDGESTDDSADRVRSWIGRDDRIRLLSNPAQTMPHGLNIGIQATHSDVVGVISGHSWVEPDYVARAVESLQRTGAWCVGARAKREASTPMQRAIARASASPIGIGDATYNYSTVAGWAEGAFPGMWWRWVFERVGLFDVAMTFNEDNELSHRILAAGGRIWFEPSIVVHYVPRASLSALFHQYRGYGRGKVAVFRKHPSAVRWRHLVPPAWVAWLPTALVLGLLRRQVWLVGAVSISVYGAILWLASRRNRDGSDSVALTLRAFVAIHAGYGIGVWQGVLDVVRPR